MTVDERVPGAHPQERGPDPRAAVFDLDGVLTFTARVHFQAWKELFDDFLGTRGTTTGPVLPFTEEDYRLHVDGRPRHDGVRAFLASRGIVLPEGSHGTEPDTHTVRGLGDRKNVLFRERLAHEGVEVDRDAARFVSDLRAGGIRVGIASSSRNAHHVLEAAGLSSLFDTVVDGVLSARLSLPGKPAPDLFLACLERLGESDPIRAMVVEDSVAGVQAGRAGGFGLVVGVDRQDHALQLREGGADWVVHGFRQLTVEHVRDWFARPGRPPHLQSTFAGWRRA